MARDQVHPIMTDRHQATLSSHHPAELEDWNSKNIVMFDIDFIGGESAHHH